MTESERIVHSEGSPWFWKIFGGAIMGIISLLLLAHITNINNNIDRSFTELRGDIREVRGHIDRHREKLMYIEQSSNNKEKIAAMEKTIQAMQTALDEHKQKVAACEATSAALKEDIKVIREWNKEMNRQLQEVRLKQATGSKTEK
jgi:septal ring factor EnvC (AmiA/AmiB activator)